jgi:hypothetical protein
MKTLEETINRTLKRLEDVDSATWPRTEIKRYLKSGYDKLVRSTRCLWDVTFLENLPYIANHTAQWEEEYMTGEGDSIQGIFNYTGGAGADGDARPWEQDYNDGIGPMQCTAPWEMEYLDQDDFPAIEKLPEDVVDVDRVTYDSYRLQPVQSNAVAVDFTNYERTHGIPSAYALDKDGGFYLRKIPTPHTRCEVFEDQGGYGIIRDQSDDEFETDPTILGDGYGILRYVPGHINSGNYGIERRVFKDQKNCRVEYFRRGHDLDKDPVFEIPDHYVKYVELYAMARAREREGDGQDLELSKHYDERFAVGVQRLLHRATVQNKERVAVLGGGRTNGSGWPATAGLPNHFPSNPFYRS